MWAFGLLGFGLMLQVPRTTPKLGSCRIFSPTVPGFSFPHKLYQLQSKSRIVGPSEGWTEASSLEACYGPG